MENIITNKRQATMTIAYEKGEQVITHPTGVVSKYTVKDLEARKEWLLADQKRIEEMIAKVDKDIATVENRYEDVKPVEEKLDTKLDDSDTSIKNI